MGNSPSSDLGVHETHSSRDARLRDPEKEVERSSASRAPTHNEYEELPASQKPYTGAQTWGQEVRPSDKARSWSQKPHIDARLRSQEVRDTVPVPNSRTSANSNTVPEPSYEEVQVPTCSSSTNIQRGAWKSENSLYDRPSPSRTHQEFDRQFDRKYQQHQKQFDQEFRQQFDRKFIQSLHRKFDVDPEDQFDRKFIQNFDQRFLQDSNLKSIQDPDRKFDADPTEKFDQSNLNQIV